MTNHDDDNQTNKYYMDKDGHTWWRFNDSPWVENDILGRGVWDSGKGLLEISAPNR